MNAFDRQAQVLGGRDSKKVAHNTYVQRRGAAIALKYHATDIVTYWPDKVVIDTNGWKTSTTKLRLNEGYAYLNGFRFFSDKGLWWLSTPESTGELSKYGYPLHVQYPYEDGLTLVWDATEQRYTVDPATIGSDPKAVQKLRKKVDSYAKGFIAALRAGKVGPPSLGDCMYCSLRTVDTHIPVGEAFKDKEHIMSHITERYYVPSLLVRATEVMPCSQVMKWAIGEQWAPKHELTYGKTQEQQTFEKINGGGWDSFVWQELSKMLKRYVLRQLGEVA